MFTNGHSCGRRTVFRQHRRGCREPGAYGEPNARSASAAATDVHARNVSGTDVGTLHGFL